MAFFARVLHRSQARPPPPRHPLPLLLPIADPCPLPHTPQHQPRLRATLESAPSLSRVSDARSTAPLAAHPCAVARIASWLRSPPPSPHPGWQASRGSNRRRDGADVCRGRGPLARCRLVRRLCACACCRRARAHARRRRRATPPPRVDATLPRDAPAHGCAPHHPTAPLPGWQAGPQAFGCVHPQARRVQARRVQARRAQARRAQARRVHGQRSLPGSRPSHPTLRHLPCPTPAPAPAARTARPAGTLARNARPERSPRGTSLCVLCAEFNAFRCGISYNTRTACCNCRI